jgi:hypothetical protein
VFGWRVLGIRGTTGPSLFRSDPWSPQVKNEWDPVTWLAPADDPPSLVDLLGGGLREPKGGGPVVDPLAPRWRNLWRRTDYLGFPVFSYWSQVGDAAPNPIDRGATERSPRTYLWSVARHNDYVSTFQYTAARDELIAALVDHHGESEPKPRSKPAPAAAPEPPTAVEPGERLEPEPDGAAPAQRG